MDMVDNYPPSLYGKGRINPTQNFVDAFPAANGYPITDPRSGYDAKNPYANRDPRLTAYVVVDGGQVGVNNTKINTEVGSGKDGINTEVGSSTRTGYYLRKLLRQDINLDPKVNSKQYHYTPATRLTTSSRHYATVQASLTTAISTSAHSLRTRCANSSATSAA